MKKRYTVLITGIVLLLLHCSSPKKSAKETTGVWVNKEKMQGKSYDSIFIVVMTADIQVRLQLENDLATAASSKGRMVVKSSEVLPPSLENPKMPEKDSIVQKVKESGCDALFVASLLRKEEEVGYTPGTTTYSVQPYAYYYSGYYSRWAPSVSTPGYFTDDKNYVITSNLYDVASTELMWSVQSKVLDPASIKKFSESYMSSLIKQLESQNLLKK
ncbi:MAG TPA: hypothetical protein VFI06_11290 [Chitinophagaceae bacterium]|nr:hypothetical protein [Chitinophagaceae bacterium]